MTENQLSSPAFSLGVLVLDVGDEEQCQLYSNINQGIFMKFILYNFSFILFSLDIGLMSFIVNFLI